MKLSKLFPLILLLALSLLSTACNDISDKDVISEPDLLKLGEFTDNGVTVAAYSEKPLQVGYNRIWFEVHEDGVRFDQPHIHFNTMMHMEHHSHASPYGEPGHHRDEEHDLYKGWAIFTMPSGMMGSWELQLTIHDQARSGFEVSGLIEIDVEQSNNLITFMTKDESRYVLTLIEPADPSVGMNELTVALHQRESMMNFPPVLNATMEFEPWMPSMDHGSSNNVSPVHEENGFYKGQVNFNMTGDWELRFDLNINGEEIDRKTFEIDF
jgi:hypothetical protein